VPRGIRIRRRIPERCQDVIAMLEDGDAAAGPRWLIPN